MTSVQRTAAALLAAATLAACGSTASTSSGGAAQGRDGSGLETATSSPTSATDPTGGTSGTNPTGTAGTSITDVPSTDGSSTGGTSSTGDTTAPGSTDGSVGVDPHVVPKAGAAILIGIPYVDQAQSSAFTAGISSGLQTGDPKANYQYLVDDLNKRGGILGHKVSLVFHLVNANESEAQYEQEICTDFTQDHKVPFVMGGISPTLAKCLIDKGVAVLGGGGQVNTADYEKMRYWVQPWAFALDRLAVLQASEFTKMGLFTSKLPVKVGILYYDPDSYKAAEKLLVSGLKQRGVQVVAEEAFHPAGSTADIGTLEAQVQSSVLKFKTAGVTHVVAVELNAFLQGFFALYSSQQDYYPRYGWTSNQVPTNAQAAVPHKELVNSLVLGFYPTFDSENPKDYPKQTLDCFRELAAHGVQITSGNQRSDAIQACDSVRYLGDALAAGKGLGRDALVAGARKLGRSWVPGATYASVLPKGYGAGISAVRPGAWNQGCDCFAYTGKPYTVS